MSVKVINNGNAIKHIRGDSGVLTISSITVDDEAVEVSEALLSIKKNTNDDDYVLQKTMNDSNEFVFSPEDTSDLQAGKYVYDIQITVNENVYTPIIGEFVIIADITRNGVV